MSHRRAVLLMVVVTLMWSIAGVVTRHLDGARAFEITFWRSAFNALALLLMLMVLRGPAQLRHAIRHGGSKLWLSAVCWAVMYTAFMLALSLTTVANVLVTMATAPLLTALVARVALGQRLPRRTWLAILCAGLGIAWMYARDFSAGDGQHLLGVAVAFCVPIAAAINWTVIQSQRPAIVPAGRPASEPATGQADAAQEEGATSDRATVTAITPRSSDPLPAVLLGALISAAVTLPLALPFDASIRDLGLLAMLGVVQLAIPCLLVLRVARHLSAPEVALLSLLEVIFGVLWVWLASGEQPTPAVLAGGAIVIGSLVVNELFNLRAADKLRPATEARSRWSGRVRRG